MMAADTQSQTSLENAPLLPQQGTTLPSVPPQQPPFPTRAGAGATPATAMTAGPGTARAREMAMRLPMLLAGVQSCTPLEVCFLAHVLDELSDQTVGRFAAEQALANRSDWLRTLLADAGPTAAAHRLLVHLPLLYRGSYQASAAVYDILSRVEWHADEVGELPQYHHQHQHQHQQQDTAGASTTAAPASPSASPAAAVASPVHGASAPDGSGAGATSATTTEATAAAPVAFCSSCTAVFIMTLYHPAFTRQQSEVLGARLRRLQAVTAERTSATGGEGTASQAAATATSTSTTDTSSSQQLVPGPSPEDHIVDIQVVDVQRQYRGRDFVFVLEVRWSNGFVGVCRRTHEQLFEFHCRLLDTYPEEAVKETRTLPMLPGRKILSGFAKRSKRDLALSRRDGIQEYLSQLIRGKPGIIFSQEVLEFFRSCRRCGGRVADCANGCTVNVPGLEPSQADSGVPSINPVAPPPATPMAAPPTATPPGAYTGMAGMAFPAGVAGQLAFNPALGSYVYAGPQAYGMHMSQPMAPPVMFQNTPAAQQTYMYAQSGTAAATYYMPMHPQQQMYGAGAGFYAPDGLGGFSPMMPLYGNAQQQAQQQQQQQQAQAQAQQQHNAMLAARQASAGLGAANGRRMARSHSTASSGAPESPRAVEVKPAPAPSTALSASASSFSSSRPVGSTPSLSAAVKAEATKGTNATSGVAPATVAPATTTTTATPPAATLPSASSVFIPASPAKEVPEDVRETALTWGEEAELAHAMTTSKHLSVSTASLNSTDSGAGGSWKRERNMSTSSTHEPALQGAATVSGATGGSLSNAASLPNLAQASSPRGNRRMPLERSKGRLESVSSYSGESGVGLGASLINKSSTSLNESMRQRAPSVSSVTSLTARCILCNSEEHETLACQAPTIPTDELRAALDDVKCPIPEPPSRDNLIVAARQFAWLKSVRLHKYAVQLVGDTLRRLPQLTVDDLAALGMTAGASKKLLTKAEGASVPWPVAENITNTTAV